MKAQWFNQAEQIGATRWQQAIGTTDYPFAQYNFYHQLELSQSIGGKSGWYPEYLLLMEDDDTPIAIAPTFLKTHSQAEFVFDWAWADAYQRHGFQYYPKRIWAIPFSPVTGPRVFSVLDPTGKSEQIDELYGVVAQLLTARTDEQKLSSWHILFNQSSRIQTLLDTLTISHDKDTEAKEEPHLLQRLSCQFHWFNRDYQNIEHYFAHFSSRKRKAVRKERQKIIDQGLVLERKLGTELTDSEIDFFYQCYQATYAKRGQLGYLTKGFFTGLTKTMGDNILLVLASNNEGLVAASWCFFDAHSLYGRYWGCIHEYDSLHFEACYYQGIEFCIERGLQHFDPGTQGEHKIARGFEPVYSYSLHYISHPGFRDAISAFCQEEAEAVKEYHAHTTTMLPFKSS